MARFPVLIFVIVASLLVAQAAAKLAGEYFVHLLNGALSGQQD